MRQVPLTAIIPRLSIMIYTAANRNELRFAGKGVEPIQAKK